jgi:hypothetical protein
MATSNGTLTGQAPLKGGFGLARPLPLNTNLLQAVVPLSDTLVNALLKGGGRMHRAVVAPALMLASFLTVGVSLAQSTEQTDQQSNAYLYRDLFGIESVTEFPGINIFSMFADDSDCEVNTSTVQSLLRWEEQKDRGIKLRFVSFREFNERKKELYQRPTKILEAAKPFSADFQDKPEGKLWKDAVKEANHYARMPVLKFTVRTGRIEQTCFAFIEAKLTTYVETRSSALVMVELWSDHRSVRAPKAEYTVAIAAANASLWSQFIGDWKKGQAYCAQQPPCTNKNDD